MKNYNEFISESLKDKMIPVSKEDVIGDINSYILGIKKRYNSEDIDDPDYAIINELMDGIMLLYNLKTNKELARLFIDEGIVDEIALKRTIAWNNNWVSNKKVLEDENNIRNGLDIILNNNREEYIFKLLDIIKKKDN